MPGVLNALATFSLSRISLEKFRDDAQPLVIIAIFLDLSNVEVGLQDDDSNLEFELEAFPSISSEAAIETVACVKEVKSAGAGAGLTAVALLAMVPSYISRYVAASYDNEAVAIFALTFTFYLYINSFLLFGAVWAVFHSLYGSGTVNHLDYLGVHVARLFGP
ncbi:hypothetical protein FNV43_RR00275 [Rhamnella rubrinervis]|uniref:dolichyl-diphosphooligosaccharide--protein glycotransferase n=1 Tax=Rhamnella rubrinervis TaxID=2594499 RepID=A0A8K0HMR3_9ROSA|nr:hypothetical protein FNV43_RR00275 [Rhamnella rubrinervis]